QSTRSFIQSYLVKEQNTGYKHQLSAIDSRDSFLPKAVSYILKRNLGGYKRDSHEIKFMASSVDHLLEQLSDQIQHPSSGERRNKQKSNRSSEESGWTSEKVYQMLGFEAPRAEELEGSIQVSALGAQWYLPFNNHSIQQLPQIAQEIGSYIQSGKSFNFTKFYNQYSYELAFPTAMGIPFTYSMDVPTVVSLSGSAMASLQRQSKQQNQKQQNQNSRSPVPERLRLDGEYDMTYSTKKQGQMGFVAPFNSKVYASGLEHNIEVRIPLKASTGYNMKNQSVDITIEPLRQGQDEKLFEFSSNAYTTSHSVLDM
ncbi:DUF1943 domain-containing protein, partial [Salmonella enterica subsp. enterica serovar 1,4,[5],12:i:-]|nr:DUF1943 domain-containing protein [Salmonella enterica subsp. enterica serovar 1,4,[5],12:i:-]